MPGNFNRRTEVFSGPPSAARTRGPPPSLASPASDRTVKKRLLVWIIFIEGPPVALVVVIPNAILAAFLAVGLGQLHRILHQHLTPSARV
jgi:hypothetical protein